ncbi:imelysin family protein [uncultured Gilvimarinus sp.]|uniref:imelysin family protein n=1 Tax=uncultured Gilvimarinus sp. TaxID=1689143 RepID=UPI0030D94E31
MTRHVILIALTAFLCSCDRTTETSGAHSTALSPASDSPALAESKLDSDAIASKSIELWDNTGARLQDFAEHCQRLESSVLQLLENPTESQLQNTQQQWRQLHGELRQLTMAMSLATRNPGLFTPLAQALGKIDRQPIAAGYLDSVEGYPNSGLINDISLEINHTTLRQQHGLTADNEASLGLHPLEFILFGETGQRSASDFARQTKSTPELASVNQPQNRRRDYLALSGKLLCDDSAQLARQWNDRQSAIAAPYFALTPPARLQLWHTLLAAEIDTLNHQRQIHHCNFAPKGCDIRWRYRGLQGVLNAKDALLPTLARQQRSRWDEGVAAFNVALSAEPRNDAATQDAIATLARALNDRD